MTDRDVQDDVIRALADAGYRGSEGWLARGLAPPERVERFARFLARRFYYQRVVHFFKYSRALARATGRRPEEALRTDGFEALLPRAILGSRETASAVAALAVAHVRGAPGAGALPYLDDLLRYEEAMMVVEAGPREWGNGERPAAGGPAEIVEGTILLDLDHDLPEVLPALLGPGEEVPAAPRRPTRLVVARTRHGRVSVVRASEEVARLIALADGSRTIEELAAEVGVEASRLPDILTSLTEVGAIRFSTGS